MNDFIREVQASPERALEEAKYKQVLFMHGRIIDQARGMKTAIGRT
jgi:hypothetical protein